MANRKSNAAVRVRTAMLDDAVSLLGELPEKPEATVSLRQAIEILQDELRASLDKGYSYEELADILGEEEIAISPSTLKRYLALSQKDSPKRGRTRRPRRTRSAQSDTPESTQNGRSKQEAVAAGAED